MSEPMELTTDDPDIPTGLLFVEEPAAPDQFNVMLYGPPGSGKSTAAATLDGPILWLNAEGANALAYARKTARQRGTTILEVRLQKNVDPRPQMDEVYRYLTKGTEPRPRTVVIDTVGKLRELLIDAMVQQGAKNSLQQFGAVAKKLGGFVTILRDLPVNLVLLAHEDIKDEEGERIVRPLIGGALTELIPSEVDVLAYTHPLRGEDGIRYIGQLVEGRGRRAKDRSGGLGVTRELDLREWLSSYRAALAGDIPFEQESAKERRAREEAEAVAERSAA